MMPPSTYRPPVSVIIRATSRAVPGEIALASTYNPRNPCTAQATSVAACGGHTDKIISASRATTATVPASLSRAAPFRRPQHRVPPAGEALAHGRPHIAWMQEPDHVRTHVIKCDATRCELPDGRASDGRR